MAYVYEITNLVNGHFYIGSSIDFEARRKYHIYQLNKGDHHSIVLQRAFEKYGQSNFKFSVLIECDLDMRLFFEQRCISKLKPVYNVNLSASLPPSQKGRKYGPPTEERKTHISRGNFEYWFCEETSSRREQLASDIRERNNAGICGFAKGYTPYNKKINPEDLEVLRRTLDTHTGSQVYKLLDSKFSESHVRNLRNKLRKGMVIK